MCIDKYIPSSYFANFMLINFIGCGKRGCNQSDDKNDGNIEWLYY